MIEIKPNTTCDRCGHPHRNHGVIGCVLISCSCRGFAIIVASPLRMDRDDAIRVLARHATYRILSDPRLAHEQNKRFLGLSRAVRQEIHDAADELLGGTPGSDEIEWAFESLERTDPK